GGLGAPGDPGAPGSQAPQQPGQPPVTQQAGQPQAYEPFPQQTSVYGGQPSPTSTYETRSQPFGYEQTPQTSQAPQPPQYGQSSQSSQSGTPNPYVQGGQSSQSAQSGTPNPYVQGGQSSQSAPSGTPNPYVQGGQSSQSAQSGTPNPYVQTDQPGQYGRAGQSGQYDQPNRSGQYDHLGESAQSAPYDPFQAYQQQSSPASSTTSAIPPAPAAQTSPSGPVDFFGSGSYEIPQQAPAVPGRPRPAPRPEPQSEPPVVSIPAQAAAPAPASSPASPPAPAPAEPFEFEFDPDDESAAARPVTGNRPADKDGYRADDFAFVDQADDPEVNGWLDFSESRADTRAERSRKLRFRLIALAVVLVLIAAGVGVYVLLGGSVPGLTGSSAVTKSMILFRLDDSKGNAVGDALLVTDRNGTTNGTASGTGAIVVIPSQMQINSQGFGSTTFGGNMASDQPPAGQDDVSSTLGVTPDGVWTIDETTFTILVDDLGGLSLTTNTAVPASGADTKGVPLGSTSLTGAQAVAYATYSASGEAATAQAARFGQVMNALIAKLPTISNEVTSYLNLLGLIPDPSLPLSKLSPILAALAAQQNAGAITVATLPLTSADELNETAAAAIVNKLLGGTVKAGATAGQAARVLVQNGTGASSSSSTKLMDAAQAKLVNDGYTYNAGNVVSTQATTKVEVSSSADRSVAEQVAASLGLSGSAVEVVSGLSSVDDVTVVLGQDWTSLSTD
ncbi:LytR C-terminal domain-containing protein, partial [Actinospica sp. MGRD01-02]